LIVLWKDFIILKKICISGFGKIGLFKSHHIPRCSFDRARLLLFGSIHCDVEGN
jgi:hypothetical protein